jgi:predicted phage terminase large subunit-like protein
LWVNDEAHYLVLVSDSNERAGDLLEDLQAEFEANPLLINDFGEQKTQGHWESGNFITRNGFIAKAFGVRQKVRGLRVKSRRPDICIIDDLETPDTIKNPKRMRLQANWVERDLIPTMIHRQRRLLYANNRFARVMTQTILQERHPKWMVHQIKAYNKVTYEPAWGAMYSPEFYRQQEEDMGIPAAYSEYNHETKLEGKNFNEEDIQWVKMPDWHEFEMIISHWDIAYTDNETSDYNAIKIWGVKERKFYLTDCFVKQCRMKVACRWMCEKRTQIPATANMLFHYEGQFWNEEVQRNIDEAEDEYGVTLNLIKIDNPRTDKLGRMLKMVPYFQNSRIFYNEALKSHNDTQVGVMQLCAVEEGSSEHDDSPDADQQAIFALEKYTTSSRKTTGEKSWKTGRMKQTYSW